MKKSHSRLVAETLYLLLVMKHDSVGAMVKWNNSFQNGSKNICPPTKKKSNRTCQMWSPCILCAPTIKVWYFDFVLELKQWIRNSAWILCSMCDATWKKQPEFWRQHSWFFYGDGASAHSHTGLSFEQFVMKSRMHCFTVTLQPSSASFETLSCY